MLKQIYEIDGFGYLKEIKVADFNKDDNCTEELAENIVIADIPQGLYRAKWNGTEWIEDMPRAEIDALNNVLKEPTEIEMLQQELAGTNAMLLEFMESMLM
jgi:hypothetical protein